VGLVVYLCAGPRVLLRILAVLDANGETWVDMAHYAGPRFVELFPELGSSNNLEALASQI
jgi:hypothetical protein